MNKIHMLKNVRFRDENDEIIKILNDNFLFGFNNISYAICNLETKSNIAFSTNSNFINEYKKRRWIEIDTVDTFESNMIYKNPCDFATYNELHGISKNGEKMRDNRAKFGMKNGGMEYLRVNEKISISLYYHTYILDFDFKNTYIRNFEHFMQLKNNLLIASKKYIREIEKLQCNDLDINNEQIKNVRG